LSSFSSLTAQFVNLTIEIWHIGFLAIALLLVITINDLYKTGKRFAADERNGILANVSKT